ncbi:MAG: DNA topoisomerase IV, partial [Bifidobacteriaceae bacterium]|nr:DNA topoisomerase IV [Bifidobacteriaceae bacterium]
LELEQESDDLARQIEALSAILAAPGQLRQLVADELAEVAAQFGTPRRTVLLDSDGAEQPGGAAGPRSAAQAGGGPPLEVADTPCWALLSATGLMARTADGAPPSRAGGRVAHDAVRSAAPATTRGDVAAITSRGRALRISCLDLPQLPAQAGPPSLAGGAGVAELFALEADEAVVGLASLLADAPPLALGTAAGVVKRVAPGEAPGGRDQWDVIGLKPGDRVVGCGPAPEAAWLAFVSSDAQLLRFEASQVRPQGRPAGGMAGIKLAPGAQAVFFGTVLDLEAAVVASLAGSARALPGLDPGAAKVTRLALYPPKGRATGGVRCQRLLKGQDGLIAAWIGPEPARAVSASGRPLPLPAPDPRRDASGTPLAQPVAGLG